MNIRLTFAVAAALSLLCVASGASAAVYDFTFAADNSDYLNGQFTTNAAGELTSLTGVVDTATLDPRWSGSNIVTLAGLSDGALHLTPSGEFNYDNAYPVNGGTPNGGFYVVPSDPTVEFNLFSNNLPISATSSNNGVFDNADLGVFDSAAGISQGVEAGTLTIAAVPEPATWAMMLLGVGAIGAGLRMARRKDGMALTAA